MESRQARLEAALTAAFTPTLLEVEDDSARHAGHTGASAGGETHFNVRMHSPKFIGMTRVTRSRAVHDVLAPEFASGLHALSLSLDASPEI